MRFPSHVLPFKCRPPIDLIPRRQQGAQLPFHIPKGQRIPRTSARRLGIIVSRTLSGLSRILIDIYLARTLLALLYAGAKPPGGARGRRGEQHGIGSIPWGLLRPQDRLQAPHLLWACVLYWAGRDPWSRRSKTTLLHLAQPSAPTSKRALNLETSFPIRSFFAAKPEVVSFKLSDLGL